MQAAVDRCIPLLYACHTASLHVSLESGSLKNTCPMVNSVAVRRMGREATRTMASSAEPYRKGFVPYNQCSKGRYCQHIHVYWPKIN